MESGRLEPSKCVQNKLLEMEKIAVTTIEKLHGLKSILIAEGYGSRSLEINNLILAVEKDDIKMFKKYYSSSSVTGGAGSIRDIDFRDTKKNKIIEEAFEALKIYKRNRTSFLWKFWQKI